MDKPRSMETGGASQAGYPLHSLVKTLVPRPEIPEGTQGVVVRGNSDPVWVKVTYGAGFSSAWSVVDQYDVHEVTPVAEETNATP